jgi:16S rRNA (guanine(966)-N(2))-methyltransferase RsmD
MGKKTTGRHNPQCDIRPTSSKVRMAIFNSIGNMTGKTFLDLCCGTGRLGIDAISRGASGVVFVDINKKRILELKKRLFNLHLIGCSRLINSDALVFIRGSKNSFDFIIADPPYHTELAENILKEISCTGILKEDGILIIEHHKKTKLPEVEKNILLIKSKTYGDTRVAYFSNVVSTEKGSFNVDSRKIRTQMVAD